MYYSYDPNPNDPPVRTHQRALATLFSNSWRYPSGISLLCEKSVQSTRTCIPLLRTSQETAPSKLAASKQLEDCKKEESARRDFCKAIEAVSKALNVLPDTDFKASLVEPIKNLEAAGDVGIIIAADAARSAQSFVDSIAEEKESQAKEKEALGAVAEAEAKAKVARGAADMWSATVKAATAKRKSLERGAGGGGDVCKFI